MKKSELTTRAKPRKEVIRVVDSSNNQYHLEAVTPIADFVWSNSSEDFRAKYGLAWGAIKVFFLKQFPEELNDRDDRAYHLVVKAMNRDFCGFLSR